MEQRSVAVVGAGAWGTALALAAARAGNRVVLFGRDAEAMAAIRRDGENRQRLAGVALPGTIQATADPAALAGASIVLFAVPTQALRHAAEALPAAIAAGTPVVSCAKGIERGTGLLTTDVLAAVLPERPTAVLSGPSFASDVAAGLPTAVTIAAEEPALAEAICQHLVGDGFRPYASGDPTGVQLGGALKNVLAIAAGIVDGRGLGASAEAALITRGFVEMRRLAAALGGRPETLMGLSGLGDLVLTCRSLQSRNFAFGHALGRGEVPSGALAEGAFTAAIAAERAAVFGIEVPIIDAVSGILEGRHSIDDAVGGLLARPLKREDH